MNIINIFFSYSVEFLLIGILLLGYLSTQHLKKSKKYKKIEEPECEGTGILYIWTKFTRSINIRPVPLDVLGQIACAFIAEKYEISELCELPTTAEENIILKAVLECSQISTKEHRAQYEELLEEEYLKGNVEHKNRLLVILVKCCTESGNIVSGIEYLSKLQNLVLENDLPSKNANVYLVDALFKSVCNSGRNESKSLVETLRIHPLRNITSEAFSVVLQFIIEKKCFNLMIELENLGKKQNITFLYNTYDALIKGYAEMGMPAAPERFAAMLKSGFRISEGSCCAFLVRCAESRYVAFAETVAQYYRNTHGGCLTLQLFGTLMQVYSLSGLYIKASDLYPEMLKQGLTPNDTMYGCLMKFAVECGRISVAKSLFANSSPDIQNYMSLIRACGKEHDVEGALGVLKMLDENDGINMDVGACNCVLDVCINCGDMPAAKTLLKKMIDTSMYDIVSFNTILKGISLSKDLDKAEEFISEMSKFGVEPDVISYNSVINCAVLQKNITKAWELIGTMQKRGLQVDRYTCSIMIKNLRPNCSEAEVSRTLNLISHVDLCQDTVLFSTMVDACARLRDTKRLKEALIMFKKSGLQPNIHAYGTLIKAYGRCKEVDEAWLLWREMVYERKLEPNSYTYGCILDTLVANDKFEDALKMFEEMQTKYTPNTVQYSIIIKGFSQQRRLEDAMRIYSDMIKNKVAANEVTYNTLIHACTSKGDISAAQKIWKDMSASGVQPDMITYSTMIKGLCGQGLIDDALQLLRKMEEFNILTDCIVFNTILEGCSKCNRYADCKALFKKMLDKNVKPSSFTLTIMIKLYGKCGQVDEAINISIWMPKTYHFSPDSYVYTALMGCCITNHRLEKAIDIFEQMKKNGFQANNRTYGTIICACTYGGELKKAVLFTEEALAEGVTLDASVVQQLLQALLNSKMPASVFGEGILDKLRYTLNHLKRNNGRPPYRNTTNYWRNNDDNTDSLGPNASCGGFNSKRNCVDKREEMRRRRRYGS
eukprot:GHVL01036004.1.p1 GENE.GHVL01036004.1~~GHVL01036004.1.p1  ORF type:complete len:1000 (-),score=171.06 GHVL01036004.1:119-3118(-)